MINGRALMRIGILRSGFLLAAVLVLLLGDGANAFASREVTHPRVGTTTEVLERELGELAASPEAATVRRALDRLDPAALSAGHLPAQTRTLAHTLPTDSEASHEAATAVSELLRASSRVASMPASSAIENDILELASTAEYRVVADRLASLIEGPGAAAFGAALAEHLPSLTMSMGLFEWADRTLGTTLKIVGATVAVVGTLVGCALSAGVPCFVALVATAIGLIATATTEIAERAEELPDEAKNEVESQAWAIYCAISRALVGVCIPPWLNEEGLA